MIDHTEHDCLAEIAKWTVECPPTGTGPNGTCTTCKGTGHILDPRFKALRSTLADRDLSVLLACVLGPNLEVGLCVEDGEVACEFETWVPEFAEGGEHVRKVVGQGSAPTPLEAAAQAVHEFLEASIPVTEAS